MRLTISFLLMAKLLGCLRLKEKKQMPSLIKYVIRLFCMREMFLGFIRHIRNHCLLFLLQVQRYNKKLRMRENR